MKSYLPKVAGLAMLAMMVRTSAYSQDDSVANWNDGSRHHVDELIIRHHGDKDAKVTIEMKDGEVLVNGKPLSDFDDSSLSIRRLRTNRNYSFNYSLDGRGFDMPGTPGTIRFFRDDPNGVGPGFNNKVFRGRPLLGVSTDKNEDGNGVKVVDVSKGSAAEKIGLKPGDIITKIDGDEISDPASLSEKIGDHRPGDSVKVTFMRDGKEQTQTVVLGMMQPFAAVPMNRFKLDEPEIRTFTPDDALSGNFGQFMGNQPRFGIRAQDSEDGKGVKVLDVDDESTAAKAGIKEGDIITRFDGKEVNSVAQLSDAAHAAKGKVNVKVTVIRDGKSQELEVRVPRRLHTADL